MSMNKKENNKTVRSRLYTSVLLVLLALVAVTAATVAWFSIADRAKVKTMSLDRGEDPAGKGIFHGNNPAGTGDNNRL